MDPVSLSKAEEEMILNIAARIQRFYDSVEDGKKSNDWRKMPPTEKQLKILKENGYSTDGLSRGQASKIIDKLFKEKPRR